MPKRRRTRGTYSLKKVRPKDKQIIGVSGANFNTVDNYAQVLYTASFPATVTGLRWELSFSHTTKLYQNVNWAIVILRQGVTASPLSTAANGTLYAPEQNVLAWGVCTLTGAPVDATSAGTGRPVDTDMGTTKSMRKLMGGDRLVLLANLAETVDAPLRMQGAIQFFLLS